MSFEPSLPGRAAETRPAPGAQAILTVAPAALERYEEAAFCWTSETLEAGNDAARQLLSSLRPDDVGTVSAVARQAVDAQQVTIEIAELGTGPRAQHFQITVMPLTEGGGVVLLRDSTLDNTLRVALVESRRRYKDFIDISADYPWEVDANRRFAFVPPRGAFGLSPEVLIACDPASLVAADSLVDRQLPFLTNRRIENEEFWLKHADGRAVCVVVSALPLIDSDGRWIGARGVCRDVTEIRDRENTLARVRNRERVLTRIVRAFRDEVDPEGMLTVAADALARGLGAEHCHIFRTEVEGQAQPPDTLPVYRPAASFGAMAASEATEALVALAKGATAVEIVLGDWQVLAAPARYQSEANGAVILWRRLDRGAWSDDDRLLLADIANQIGITIEQLRHHEHVLRISRTDALTGLLNRGAFMEGLQRFLSRQHRDPAGHTASVLMYVDLDNFKHVNDTRGHQAGDELLLKIRSMLLAQTRPTDMVARLGGDEFAIWLSGADLEIARRRAESLLGACQDLAPYSGSPQRPVGMSIGIARWIPGSETLAHLLARADAAMYEAKRAGKGGFAVAPAAPAA